MTFKSYVGERRPYVTDCSGQSMTKQSFKDECDVTRIVKKFERTGQLPPNTKVGVFADVSSLTDYRTMLHRRRLGEALFGELSLEEKKAFNNDPGQYLLWVETNSAAIEAESDRAGKAPSVPQDAPKDSKAG